MSSREEKDFEAWWLTEQMKTFPTWYDKERLPDWGAAYKPAARKAWKASRAGLVVELPEEQPGYMYYAPDVVDAIEAAGIPVKQP